MTNQFGPIPLPLASDDASLLSPVPDYTGVLDLSDDYFLKEVVKRQRVEAPRKSDEYKRRNAESARRRRLAIKAERAELERRVAELADRNADLEHENCLLREELRTLKGD